MNELILQPGESIVLAPGEMLGAGEEPLRIRFGAVNFAVEEGSFQHKLLAAVAQYLKHAAPSGWQIEAVKHLRQLAEQTDNARVTIIPHALSRERTAKGMQYAKHEIDIIVTGKLDTDSTVALIDQWLELFLHRGGPLDCASCMKAETLDESSAGYSTEALIQTPSMFFGVLRLTFWDF